MTEWTFHPQGYPLWLTIGPGDRRPKSSELSPQLVIGWMVGGPSEPGAAMKINPVTSDGTMWHNNDRWVAFGMTPDQAVDNGLSPPGIARPVTPERVEGPRKRRLRRAP
jgi:hypothetical protein